MDKRKGASCLPQLAPQKIGSPIKMTFSKQDFNPLERIAQLHQEIATAELERRHLRLAAIVELRSQGLSLRTIAGKVGLSHGAVNQILAVYEAGNK